ncbi:MAG: porin family protein [Campylobacterales bacterium]|nr:porin family protein [Campylobacterales bacterium]
MKKIALFIPLFFSSLLFGESQIYMGTSYGYSNVSTKYANSTVEETYSEDTVRIKAGYGQREAYAVEFSMEYIESQPKKYAFDISVIKAFDWGIYVNPYIKAGFGAGILDNRENEDKSLTYGSFNLGTGLFIPMGKHFDFELAYEYKNRSYQKVNELDGTESRTSHVNMFYSGINVRF